MINIKQKEEDLLNEHYNLIISEINKFQKKKQGFIMKDIINSENYDYYRIHMTKGILHCLISLDYIEIIALYNGYKNFIYLCKKEIPLKNKSKQI